jgi:hypothetical protein
MRQARFLAILIQIPIAIGIGTFRKKLNNGRLSYSIHGWLISLKRIK